MRWDGRVRTYGVSQGSAMLHQDSADTARRQAVSHSHMISASQGWMAIAELTIDGLAM